MKTIYLVIKASVYRHDIFGTFEELDDAKSLADELAATDIDNHHGYDVIPVPLNGHYEITQSSRGNGTGEDVAVYSATKQE
ncbi:MAG: hypothetical protein ACC650_00330 [Gammaproteobacteria bacterium]